MGETVSMVSQGHKGRQVLRGIQARQEHLVPQQTQGQQDHLELHPLSQAQQVAQDRRPQSQVQQATQALHPPSLVQRVAQELHPQLQVQQATQALHPPSLVQQVAQELRP